MQNHTEACENQVSDEQSRRVQNRKQNDPSLKGSFALKLRGNPCVTRDVLTRRSYKDVQVRCLLHLNPHD